MNSPHQGVHAPEEVGRGREAQLHVRLERLRDVGGVDQPGRRRAVLEAARREVVVWRVPRVCRPPSGPGRARAPGRCLRRRGPGRARGPADSHPPLYGHRSRAEAHIPDAAAAGRPPPAASSSGSQTSSTPRGPGARGPRRSIPRPWTGRRARVALQLQLFGAEVAAPGRGGACMDESTSTSAFLAEVDVRSRTAVQGRWVGASTHPGLGAAVLVCLESSRTAEASCC